MPYGNPRCATCSSPNVAALELAFAQGVKIAPLARRFNLSYPSVSLHCKKHIPADLLRRLKAKALRAANVEVLEELRQTESQDLLARIVHTRARINQILNRAEEDKDWRGAILAIKTLHENFSLTGRLLGELSNGTVVNNNSLIVSPDYLKLRALLIQALQPYPAARIAVAKALRTRTPSKPGAAPTRSFIFSDLRSAPMVGRE